MRRERVEVRRVNEGVVTAGEEKRYTLAFLCGRDIEKGKTKEKRKVTSHLLACYPMEADVNDGGLAFGPMLEYGCMGRGAPLDSDGVMIIENGHVTMVASGWISSLAMIESPDETNDSIGTQRASDRQPIDIARTRVKR